MATWRLDSTITERYMRLDQGSNVLATYIWIDGTGVVRGEGRGGRGMEGGGGGRWMEGGGGGRREGGWSRRWKVGRGKGRKVRKLIKW